jgi:hypothetical protein
MVDTKASFSPLRLKQLASSMESSLQVTTSECCNPKRHLTLTQTQFLANFFCVECHSLFSLFDILDNFQKVIKEGVATLCQLFELDDCLFHSHWVLTNSGD